MNERQMSGTSRSRDANGGLMRYYFVRTAFSALWVALAFSVGQRSPEATAVLLFVYPRGMRLPTTSICRAAAWNDRRAALRQSTPSSAWPRRSRSSALNARMHWVLGVFGVWGDTVRASANSAPLCRRWNRFAAQWAMALSGCAVGAGRRVSAIVQSSRAHAAGNLRQVA